MNGRGAVCRNYRQYREANKFRGGRRQHWQMTGMASRKRSEPAFLSPPSSWALARGEAIARQSRSSYVQDAAALIKFKGPAAPRLGPGHTPRSPALVYCAVLTTGCV